MMTSRDEKKTSAISLEDYVESLDSLPAQVHRNFKRMQDLSGREQSIMQEIDRIGSEFLKMAGKATREQRKERIGRIEDLFNKAKECGDDRVQLSEQTYELVDQHIKRLDSDLAKFRIRNRASMAVRAGPAPPARIKRRRTEVNELKESTSAWLGMPVDTNEPTYCICRRVSYGDMVACDNKECEIEWFHYDCMGLSCAPQGDWYCPKCRPGPSSSGN